MFSELRKAFEYDDTFAQCRSANLQNNKTDGDGLHFGKLSFLIWEYECCNRFSEMNNAYFIPDYNWMVASFAGLNCEWFSETFKKLITDVAASLVTQVISVISDNLSVININADVF